MKGLSSVMGSCEWPEGLRGAAPGSKPVVRLCGKPAEDRTPAGVLKGGRRIPVCADHLSVAEHRLQRLQDSDSLITA